MTFRELSKKMIKTIALREVILSFIMVFVFTLFREYSLIGTISYTLIITLGILAMSHTFLVFRVKKRLTTLNNYPVYLCIKKNALLVNNIFFLSHRENGVVKVPFPSNDAVEETDLTIDMIMLKDSLVYNKKEYHLIEFK